MDSRDNRDNRLSEIKEGAGLEASRINQDLLDFLNKWSMPVLVLAMLIVGGMWAKRYFEQRAQRHTDDAYLTFNSALAGGNPSPDSLRQIAEEYDDVPGLADMARLTAATLYLQSAYLGLRPGAELAPDGSLANPDDALSPEQVDQYLQTADELYQRVLANAEEDGRTLMALNAGWGRAAIAASLGRPDDARALYQRTADIAEAGGFPVQAKVAREKAEGVGDLAEPPRLFKPDELPPIVITGSEPAQEAVTGEAPDAPPAEAQPDAAEAQPGDEEAAEQPASEPMDEGPSEQPVDEPPPGDDTTP